MEDGSFVHFSPDGRWLASTGGGCRLWMVDSCAKDRTLAEPI